MGLGSNGKIIRIGACTVVIAAGTVACLAMGWQAGEMLHAKLSHSEKADGSGSCLPRFRRPAGQTTAARPSALANALMRSKDQQQVALAVSDPPQSVVAKSTPPAPEVVAAAGRRTTARGASAGSGRNGAGCDGRRNAGTGREIGRGRNG